MSTPAFGTKEQRRTLSVVMPMHEMKGYAAFLRHNLDILSEQTFKDFDVVISDQSKADNIRNICEEYKNKLDIKYFHNPTGPYTSAYNTNYAMKKATGKLIKILFLDDFLFHKNALKDIVENFDMEKDHWLVTACEHTTDGKTFIRPFYPRYHDKIHLGDNTISSPSVMTIKNEDLMFFDERMVWLMDVDYYKRLHDKYGQPKILNTINVVNTNGPHQASNTTATRQRRAEEYVWVLKKHGEKELLRDFNRQFGWKYKLKFFVWRTNARLRKTPLFSAYKRTRLFIRNVRYNRESYNPSYLAGKFIWAKILNRIQNARAYRNIKKRGIVVKKLKDVRTVILVHSLRHFDPVNDKPARDNYYSSTGSIGRHIWAVLEGKERIHVDIKTRSVEDLRNFMKDKPEPDLIIGLLSENFIKLTAMYPKARKILFSVNCHPMFRAEVLIREAKKLGKNIPGIEWVDPNLLNKTRNYIDIIAMGGNDVIKKTYDDYGLKEISVIPINFGVNFEIIQPKRELQPKNKVRFLYPATDMGIRKGFFRILKAWEKLNTLVPPDSIELVLMGQVSFKKELDEFLAKYSNAKYLGWSAGYVGLIPEIQASHAVLCPTLEEGQVGSVLDAMGCGVVPILTPHSGITIEHGVEGFILKDHTDSDEMAGYMRQLIENIQLRDRMSQKVVTRITKDHTWGKFREDMKRIIETGSR